LQRVLGGLETKEIAASRDFLGEFVRRLLPESPVRVTFVVFAKPSLDDLLLAVGNPGIRDSTPK
ncbi:MAG: hypothetical protein WBW14_32740, partial [Candidatus Acidiferrum sp.]